MPKYFEVTVELRIETEVRGETKIKKYKENYLVDAMSCTEAEARVVKQFESFSQSFSQEFEVQSVRASKILEVISADEEENKRNLTSIGIRLKQDKEQEQGDDTHPEDEQ